MAHCRTPRLVLVVLLSSIVAHASCKDDGPYFIRGTARLPDCVDAPAADLDGSEWIDSGPLTIESAGCGSAMASDMFNVCGLIWVMSQEGGEIEIIVDNEYRILGRLCGTDLHLEGGWWLPVEDEGICTYEEDSAEEVGIQQGGSTLSLALQPGSTLYQATGTILVSGPCDASYDMTLTQLR